MIEVFHFPPRLKEPPQVRFSHLNFVERKRDGSELRSTLSSHYLREWTFDFLLRSNLAQKARDFFDRLQGNLVKVPDWTQPARSNFNGQLEKFEDVDFEVNELFVTDLRDESYEVVPHSGDLSTQVFGADKFVYPIRICTIEKLPSFNPFSDLNSAFSVTFVEDISSYPAEKSRVHLDPFDRFEGSVVFPFEYKNVNELWQDSTKYDKKSFGAKTSYLSEDLPKREVSLEVLCSGRRETRLLIDFFELVKGRGHGFWFSPRQSNFKLIEDAAIGSSSLRLDGEFPLRRSQATFIQVNSVCGSRELHRVTSVNGQTVTLENPLQSDREASKTSISFLYKVRLGSDDLDLAFNGDQIVKSQLKLVELVQEYETAQVPKQPKFIYEFEGFWQGRLTSYGRPIDHAGDTYSPANIQHEKITYKEQSLKSSCSLSFTPENEDHPFYVFRQGFPLETITIKISRLDDGVATPIYEANVREAVFAQQRTINFKLGSFADIADGELPAAYFEKRCSRQFLRTGCNLDKADYEITGPLISSFERRIEVEEAAIESVARGFPDWFLSGQVVIGKERRVVIAQNGRRLTLSTPFINAQPGDTVTLLPGCNRTSVYCVNRFNNYVNFGGTPNVPPANPQLEAVRVNSSIPQGGKK